MGQSEIIAAMKIGKWYTISDLCCTTKKSNSAVSICLLRLIKWKEVERKKVFDDKRKVWHNLYQRLK